MKTPFTYVHWCSRARLPRHLHQFNLPSLPELTGVIFGETVILQSVDREGAVHARNFQGDFTFTHICASD